MRNPLIRLTQLLLLFAVTITVCSGCAQKTDPAGRSAYPTELPTENVTAAPTEEPTPEPLKDVVRFSVPGGYYGDTVLLDLEAPEGYTIYYTRDGTPPDENAKLYTGTISVGSNERKSAGPVSRNLTALMGIGDLGTARIKRGTIIRAVGIDAEGNRTPIATETYMVWNEGIDTYGVPLISLSLVFDDFATESGIYYQTMLSP